MKKETRDKCILAVGILFSVYCLGWAASMSASPEQLETVAEILDADTADEVKDGLVINEDTGEYEEPIVETIMSNEELVELDKESLESEGLKAGEDEILPDEALYTSDLGYAPLYSDNGMEMKLSKVFETLGPHGEKAIVFRVMTINRSDTDKMYMLIGATLNKTKSSGWSRQDVIDVEANSFEEEDVVVFGDYEDYITLEDVKEFSIGIVENGTTNTKTPMFGTNGFETATIDFGDETLIDSTDKSELYFVGIKDGKAKLLLKNNSDVTAYVGVDGYAVGAGGEMQDFNMEIVSTTNGQTYEELELEGYDNDTEIKLYVDCYNELPYGVYSPIAMNIEKNAWVYTLDKDGDNWSVSRSTYEKGE